MSAVDGERGMSINDLTAKGDGLVKELVAAAHSLLKATNSAMSDPSGWVAPLNRPTGPAEAEGNNGTEPSQLSTSSELFQSDMKTAHQRYMTATAALRAVLKQIAELSLHRQNDNVGDTRLEGEEDLSSLRKEIADLQEEDRLKSELLEGLTTRLQVMVDSMVLWKFVGDP